MLYVICALIVLFPLMNNFLQTINRNDKSKNSLRGIYSFLILLNFSITFFTTANFANFLFYTAFVYLLTFGFVFAFFVFFFVKAKKLFQANLYEQNFNLSNNSTSLIIELKKILKPFFSSIWVIFLMLAIFFVFLIFYSVPGWDESAYINFSENFKNDYYSFGNSYSLTNIFSWTSFSSYQYSGIYFAYSVWSGFGSSVPFYCILTPLIYWIINSFIINDLSILFFKQKTKYYWFISLFVHACFLAVSVMFLHLLRGGNFGLFELVTILLGYEILTSKKDANYSFGLNLYIPLAAICFFSSTGYLFLIPGSAALIVMSFLRRDIKNFFAHVLIFLFLLFISFSMLKLWWLGYVVSSIVITALILTFNMYWKKRQTFFVYLEAFFNTHIFINALKKDVYWNSKFKNYKKICFIVFSLLLLVMIPFLLPYTEYGNIFISIMFFILISTQVFLLRLKPKSNFAAQNYSEFIYVVWIIAMAVGLIMGRIVNIHGSFGRIFFFCQGFSRTLFPYPEILFVSFSSLIISEYPKFSKNKSKVNFKRLFLILLPLVGVSSAVAFWFVLGMPVSINLKNYFSANVFHNLYMLDENDIKQIKKIELKKQGTEFATIFTDAVTQPYLNGPAINNTSYLFQLGYNDKEFEEYFHFSNFYFWHYMSRTLNPLLIKDETVLQKIADRIMLIANYYSKDVDYFLLNKQSTYYSLISRDAFERRYDIILETQNLLVYKNVLSVS